MGVNQVLQVKMGCCEKVVTLDLFQCWVTKFSLGLHGKAVFFY